MARESDMIGTIPSSAAAPAQTVAAVAAADSVEPAAGSSQPSRSESSSGHKRTVRSDSPILAGLISMILHTILLLILALFTYSARGGHGSAITARQGEPAATIALDAVEKSDRRVQDPSLAPQPIAVNLIPRPSATIASPLSTPSTANPIDPALLATLKAGGALAQPSSQFRLPGGGLSGRTAEGRAKYGRKWGATRESEQAVDEALRWLADHQRPNGSWSFNLQLDPCNGRCRHSKKAGDTPTPSTAATGLALLAFLGAGHTHHGDGPYAETVRQGLYYLRAVAGEAEAGYDFQQGSMYGQGIALMALSEALAMTTEGQQRDADLVDLVHRGAWFTVIAQHESGSWGYVPGSPGDTTLTGWQVLSLLAAKRTGAPLKTYTLRDAREFVLSTSSEDQRYQFGYQRPPGEVTTTAIGLTLLLYLGESPNYTPFFDALTELADRGPTLTNVYHDYYATLALHHSQHPHWDRWNNELRDFLVAKQAKSGHERGSWHFDDRWGNVGGRLYTTAMCAMILEVYYRYMPLYAEVEDFPL